MKGGGRKGVRRGEALSLEFWGDDVSWGKEAEEPSALVKGIWVSVVY